MSKFRLRHLVMSASMMYLFAAAGRAENDPTGRVMDYYLSKLDSVLTGRYIFQVDTTFSVKVRSIFIHHDSRGGLRSSDTAVYELKFENLHKISETILDSSTNAANNPPDTFTFQFPQNSQYIYNFFPNDTGAGILAIGFDPPEYLRDSMPDGIVTFDRTSYNISRLILNFIEREGYQRYSVVYEFEEISKLLTLKSLQINAAKSGFLRNVYYRRIFEFYDYNIIGR